MSDQLLLTNIIGRELNGANQQRMVCIHWRIRIHKFFFVAAEKQRDAMAVCSMA